MSKSNSLPAQGQVRLALMARKTVLEQLLGQPSFFYRQ